MGSGDGWGGGIGGLKMEITVLEQQFLKKVFKKWAKDLNRQFSKEDIQRA